MSTDDGPVVLIEGEPPFYESLHASYIVGLASKLDAPTSYEGAVTEHLRMSGVYWSLTALSLIRSPEQVDNLMGLTTQSPTKDPKNPRPSLVDWVMSCYDPRTGGFGGNVGHDSHLLYTLSAIQILALADALDRVDAHAVTKYVASLQQPDGSFCGDEWGEIDTRFTYCALATLSILHTLHAVHVDRAAQYVLACRNTLDGGFGCVVGAESHAGQVFCCIGALSIAKSLHRLEEDDNAADLLAWWLAERQVDSGGLNGRPEKQADVCYSWWILSALSVLGRISWINGDKLATFILKCQDENDGGIADRPDDMADVFHTFFGIAGLSLLGHLKANDNDGRAAVHRQIDPVYALPTDVVTRLGLQAQVLTRRGEPVDERLQRYDVYNVTDDSS